MPTPIADLTVINPLTEIILRAGDLRHPQARENLRRQYELDADYGVIGLSVVFRPSATLDELVRAAHFPHPKISFSVIAKVREELALVGFVPVLFVTPTPDLPDHHTLAVADSATGTMQLALSDAAANALIAAVTVVDNPYQQPRKPR